ncbi:MAG TPA: UvrD-helicase domain-containing protein [Longimicrobiales bacterium]|nr:UvrD-helicase domain-containing protein [Longimicrobiales bacterium]
MSMPDDQLSLFSGASAPAEDVADAAAVEPGAGPVSVALALPDAEARRRIVEDLRTSLIVEAGAGAGKTTEMVRRMVALVESGLTDVSGIAAVTFTRKAAAELRERFQTDLERRLRAALDNGDGPVARRLDAALREIDQAFLGTIHAFCARLLRERPLDAGIDPSFRETMGAEELRLQRRFWHEWLERLAVDGDPRLAGLQDVALAPAQVEDLFRELASQPDVAYPAALTERPDAGGVRRRVERAMDVAASVMPADEPAGGWDALQTTLRMLRFHRFVLGWSRDERFLEAVAPLTASSFRVTRNRWDDSETARVVQEELETLFREDGAGHALLQRWWAYRYPIAMEFARAAALAWEEERRRTGVLNFQDLLMFAARLLRDSPAARRELSERYRYLLVDEFQDTDPVQAEVLFLLASDEEPDLFVEGGAAPPPFASWRHLTPRPGALFVVGDPKQSIYRFRRADMTLYQQVRGRFDVVELTSNFRSRPAIERFVNETFSQRFPERSEPEQAGFAPMRVQHVHEPGVVAWYELDDPVNLKVADLASQDASRLATWMAGRVSAGDRRPGDFLVLTRNTRHLGLYARALERRNIPVQVTGAGVGGTDNMELEELRLLLRCLCDPGDPTLVVAVLTGLLFGMDYEQLVQHAERADGPPFSFTRPWQDPEGPVEEALATLHRYWRMSRTEPADVAVPRMVDELGLLPFAAAGELGESRAGAVLYALEAVRRSALHGDASLHGALDALETTLEESDGEAPLEPGRSDVVRVMNLHKAKGLEANVVVLAAPFGDWSPMPASRVVRDVTGRAVGYTTVCEQRGFGQRVPLAQPADWATHEAEELRFSRAEDERLLYVAATRAVEELVVGCAYNPRSPSPWRSFHPWLRQHGSRLELPQPVPGRRLELEASGADVAATVAAVDQARLEHGRPTYRVASVSERKLELADAEVASAAAGNGAGAVGGGEAHEPAESAAAGAVVQGRGTAWGTAVHDGLQYAAQGLAGDALRHACRDRLAALERPLDSKGEPLELGELLDTIAAVRSSPLWQRATASGQWLVEVPFALRLTAREYARISGAAVDEVPDDAPDELVDGRIDLAFREAAGWVIVDYKTDAAGDAIPPALMRRYRAQLALYAAAWEQISGEAVVETSLLFTGALTPASS